MTQREGTYLLRNALSLGAISDDNPIPTRRLLYRLKNTISQILHRNLSKNTDFDNESIFTYDCIELTEVDRAAFLNIPPSGLTWKRSIKALPPFIKLLSVNDVLGSTTLPVIGWDRLSAHTNSRIKAVSKSPVATFKNIGGDGVYIYAMTTNNIISATVVPTDYAQAVLFPRCGEVSNLNCDWWNIPIGASNAVVNEAIQFLIAEEVKVGASVKPDDTNNDNAQS